MDVEAPLRADALERAIAGLTKADRAALPHLVADLKAWLGVGLTAMIGAVNETRYVQSWIDGSVPRRPEALRAAWRAASIIVAIDGPETARAWMSGQNPALDFHAPVRILRDKNDDESRSTVVRAAVRFAAG